MSANKVLSNSRSPVNYENQSPFRLQRSSVRFRTGPRCYNCGSSHLLKQCPYSTRQRFSEATVRRSPDTNTTNGAKGSQAISNVVSNVTPVDDDTNISRLTVDPHLDSNNGEINNVIDSVIAQMHGITSSFSTGNIQLGPVLTAEVSVEGEIIEALLDTGSPVTIIQLEALLEILAKQRHPDQTISEWSGTTIESRLEPTSLILKNYSGDNLKIVRQIRISMSRPGYSTSAVVQVQSGAPAKLLVGTDLLSRLGYFFVQASEDYHDLDMLTTESENTLGDQSIQQRDGSNKEGM